MGESGLVLMSQARLSKSLTQFSTDGQGCVPSLLFDKGQAMVGYSGNGDLLQTDLGPHCSTQCS